MPNYAWKGSCAYKPRIKVTFDICIAFTVTFYRKTMFLRGFFPQRVSLNRSFGDPLFRYKHNRRLFYKNNYAYNSKLRTCHIFVDASRVAASCCFIETPCVTAVFFLHFSSRERRFVSRIILFQTVIYAIVPKMQSWAHVIFLLTRGATRGSNGIARQPHGRARQPSRATK